MDPGTLGGIGLAFVAILLSMIMDGGNPGALIAPPAIILVLGGTFGAAMAGNYLRDSIGVVAVLKRALLAVKPVPPDEVIDTVVGLAERARKEGLLALEAAARDIDDPFLRKGLELAVDGTDPEEVRELLEAEIAVKRGHDKSAAKFFTDMGGYAPTIGIIGTVIGLVHVLQNLNSPSTLGHLIAAAFIATLWGVLTANVIWLPLGNKVRRVSETEAARMELLVEGITAIQAGANPRLVRMKLHSLLPETAAAGKAAGGKAAA